MVVPFSIIWITSSGIQSSGVYHLNFERVLELVGFTKEECYLVQSYGKGVAVNGTNFLKGSLIKGGLEPQALVTMGPYLYTITDLASLYGIKGYLCQTRL